MAQLQFNRQILDKLVYPNVSKSGERLQNIVRSHQSTNGVLHVRAIGETVNIIHTHNEVILVPPEKSNRSGVIENLVIDEESKVRAEH